MLILRPEEYLLGEAEQQCVNHIYSLCKLVRDGFERHYYPVLLNLSALVHFCPASREHHSTQGGLLLHILESTVEALRIRAGMRLPIGASVELEVRKRPLWTFTIFAATILWELAPSLARLQIRLLDDNGQLLEDAGEWVVGDERPDRIRNAHGILISHIEPAPILPRSASLLLAPTILPPMAFRWLRADSDIYRVFLEAFDSASNATVSKLINDAYKKSINHYKAAAGRTLRVDETKVLDARIRDLTGNNALLKAVSDLSESDTVVQIKAAKANQCDGSQAIHHESEPASANKEHAAAVDPGRTCKSALTTQSMGVLFSIWLLDKVSSTSTNQENLDTHIRWTAAGLFLEIAHSKCTPIVFREFVDWCNNQTAQAYSSDFVRLKLLEEGLLVPSPDGLEFPWLGYVRQGLGRVLIKGWLLDTTKLNLDIRPEFDTSFELRTKPRTRWSESQSTN